jgi:site-specific DNA recombinase
MSYCIYLRKSRADMELEAHGEGETLARHEKTLLDLAKRQKLPICQIYREIVSGETIAARPVVQQLLSEIEKGLWEGVLVMEVERLARGDTIDQGIIAQTFKFTNTKIITPNKTYNPGNEFDEEYFEFGLFMSRREYKTINRRLQQGRLASVKEGKWVGNVPPFGYERIKLRDTKGFSLSPIPQEADIISMIFRYYANGKIDTDGAHKQMGMTLIARELNQMKVPSRSGKPWTLSTIRDILQNPVYIGKVRWGHRANTKKIDDGRVVLSRPKQKQYTLYDGLHQPLVDQETFAKVQQIIKSRHNKPVPGNAPLKNPLSGLVVCGCCGSKMQRKPSNQKNTSPSLVCYAENCHNKSSLLHIVENKIIEFLGKWLEDYKMEMSEKLDPAAPLADEIKSQAALIQRLQKDSRNLEKQIDNIHNLLEQGIYSVDKFLERSKILNNKAAAIKDSLKKAVLNLQDLEAKQNNIDNFIPKVENVLQVYPKLTDAKAKNNLLKEVIEKVVYIRKEAGKHIDPNNFEITVYPKIPKN